MKKIKIIVLALIIPLVLSIAACKSDKAEKAAQKAAREAYQLYTAALEKTNGQTDITSSQKVAADMTINIGKQKVSMRTAVMTDSKIKNYHKEDMLVEVHQSQTVSGSGQLQTSRIDLFSDKTNLYFSIDNDPYTVVSRDSAQAKQLNDILDSMTGNSDPGLKEEMFKGAQIVAEEGGARRIVLALTDEQMKEMVKESVDSSLAAMKGIGAVDIEYDLSDVEYSVVIDPNGFLTEVRMSCVMNMDMTVQGKKAASTSTISATSKILDVGKAVTITIPEV